MRKLSIRDIAVSGKRCLVRVDYNVPQSDDGVITDDNRIKATLPTIRYLKENGAKVILVSHLGRPDGKIDAKFSLKPVAKRLSSLLGEEVPLAADIVGESAQKVVSALENGGVCMLENLRFCPEEEENDQQFCQKLAAFADIYVNDAFGTAHRAHASTAGVARFANCSVCGFLMERELEIIGGALENPKRPLVAILGGSKVSDKIGVIENLINKADTLLIGGGMSYTFCRALGGRIGASLCEEDKIPLAKKLLAKAEARGTQIILPQDNVVADKFSNDAQKITCKSGEIPNNFMGMDIGPKTIESFFKYINGAGTIIWNGPLGVFEMPNFAVGTFAVARAVAQSRAISIIGGGDSALAVARCGCADKITHISTGGGATLIFLEGKELPGVACLNNKK